MPHRFLDVFACWKGCFSKQGNSFVLNAVPFCVMWLVWRVRKHKAFEGTEGITMELKMILLCVLFNWIAALHNPLSSSLLDFLDTCSFY